MKTETLNREDYENANGITRWWSKDGAWHVARPEFSHVTGKVEKLWTTEEYKTRDEAIAALQ